MFGGIIIRANKACIPVNKNDRRRTPRCACKDLCSLSLRATN